MKKGVVFILSCAILSGCSGSSWFGTDNKPKAEGERISILEHESSLKLDDSVANPDIVLPTPEAALEWPQAGGLSHHDMEHLYLKDGFTEIWSANIGEGSSSDNFITVEPVIANGIVFTLDSEGLLSATSLTDGSNLWESALVSRDDSKSLKSAGIAYDGGVIFATAGTGGVYAFNAKNGKLLWKRNMKTALRAAPTVYGGRVFVLSIDNRIYALSGYSGEELWHYDAVAEPTIMLGAPAPAADKGFLVVAFSSGELYALKTDTGVPIWSDTLLSPQNKALSSNLLSIKARPVISDNVVYTIANDGMITATNLFSGERIWEKDVSGTNQTWLAGKYIFVLNDKNEVMALTKEDGKLLWVTQLQMWEDEEDNEDRILWTGPILAGDKLILASSHGFLAVLSPYTGAVQSQVEIDEGVSVAPVNVEDVLLIIDNSGELRAFR